ncbi:MAG: TIGR02594 family protein [Devosia sp.]|uniref:NlpC/P60 family protein n=1 Tax=Devosia sp. TaxID=1871048 RepID=UPI001AC74AC7|nr:TIGR02594 family protein [Devosia sp.]MBN9315991.1 TIGR02594 family protein [Devosia sp.]
MNVLEIQQALHAKGFDPGPHDGIRGRRTIDAIMRFQAANGLVVDGIVGPVTAKVLFTTFKPSAKPVVGVELPWYAEAWRLVGVTEDGSAGSNQQILAWARDLGIPYGDDEIPWCGLFVAHCIGSQLTNEPLPTGPLGARSWGRFGNEVKPQPGAVMVFWRGSKDGFKGHVGFYAGEEKGGPYHILGGNQMDKVCVTKVARDRFLHARWPSTVPAANGKALVVAADGKPVSTNEA